MPAFLDRFVESVAEGKLLQGGRPARHGIEKTVGKRSRIKQVLRWKRAVRVQGERVASR